MAKKGTTAHLRRLRTRKRALAAAVGMALCTSAFANDIEGFRLIIDDVISSHEAPEVTSGNDRLPFNSLIQSHPDPAYLTLQQKYKALPPFTQALEETGEQYIAEASAAQRLVEGMWAFAGEASSIVADVRTEVRHDDRRNEVENDYTTTLATVNPTFHYQLQRRKWKLEAEYDYTYGHYAGDRDEPMKDHTVDVEWTYRPVRGRELSLRALYQDTSDRATNDPVTDFDGSLDPIDSNYNRRLLDARYKHGSLRDRGRWDVYLLSESTELDSGGNFWDYDLDRNAVGGSVTWQLRRQLAAIGEVRFVDFDYREDGFDYKHTRYLAGPDVILGRRLRAKVRLGVDAVDGRNGNEQEFAWRGMTEWAMRRKSFLRLEGGRELYGYGSIYRTDDTSFDDIVVQDWLRASWKERWSSRLSTETSLTHRRIDGENRDEDASQFQFTANYQFTDRLKFAIDAAYTRMDRTFEDDFSRRTLTFRADYSI